MFPSQFTRRAADALVASVLVFPGVAISADDDRIDEIVVTADYRERSQAELPASITLLDQQVIDARAVQHFEELLMSVPNMNWSGDGNRARYFQIRGVGELAQYQGAPNPSIGVIIDDIDFSGIGSVATLFDIDRIEILRGPHGTRYGANALGGLIYLRSTEPGSDQPAVLQFGAGDSDTFSGGIAGGGRFSDSMEYRLSLSHYRDNGFRDNAWSGRDNTNQRRETTARAKLRWTAGDSWDMKLTGLFIDLDDGYDAFAIDNSYTVLSDKPGRDAQRSIGVSYRADWDGADRYRLTSITSFAHSDIDFAFDADWGNDNSWAPITYDYISSSERIRKTLSQEVRLTSQEPITLLGRSTDWLAGAYVGRIDEDLTTVNEGLYYDPAIDFSDALATLLQSRFDAINAALFGQMDISISDAGTLGVGLRIETRRTNYADSDNLRLGPSETMFGGDIRYTHVVAPDFNAYAGVSRGYKAGGFNIGLAPAGKREFGQELLWNVETGIKSSLLQGAMELNASLFWNSRREQQVETSVQLIPNDPASFVFFTDNAVTSKSFGLEADLRWQPDDAWEFYASLGLLRTRFGEFVTPLGDLGGRAQAHAPAYTIAAGGQYRHASGVFARLDTTAMGSYYFDLSHDQKSSSYVLSNARIGYETERYTAQVYVRNLFDKQYAVRGFYFGNEPPDFVPALYLRLGDPRHFGFIVDVRF